MSDYDILITRLDSQFRERDSRAEIILQYKVYFKKDVEVHKRVKLSPNVFDSQDIALSNSNEIKYIIRKGTPIFKALNKLGAKLTKTAIINSDRILEI